VAPEARIRNREEVDMKADITYLTPALAALLALPAWGFNSGSTGADGAFNPTVDTRLQLPPSGVFNFTTVNIPAGVSVTFKKNATNTPVVVLATGDVTIAGYIFLDGTSSTDVGAGGNGNIGDDGIPGVGGPGGFDGGRGGAPGSGRGGDGLGPGAGGGAPSVATTGCCYYGGGAGFGSAGGSYGAPYGAAGATYGSSLLLPLVGGSGGGGGQGGDSFAGAGGGGGGGAILIAASGTINLTGLIHAYGAYSGTPAGVGVGAVGGCGSGGAIRLVATTISGNGEIGAGSYCPMGLGGGNGRVRLEAENFPWTSATTPAFTFSAPGPLFVAGLPSLRITSVGGNAVPDVPTGDVDVVLPTDAPNPVTVQLATTGVPVGNTVSLKVTPAQADSVVVVSPALTGTTDSATTSVQVNIPPGPSVLQASVTYTVVVALGDSLSRYAQGERVEKVRLETALGESSTATLITVSGKEFVVPAAVLASAGQGG
jgi:hypothetical protein